MSRQDHPLFAPSTNVMRCCFIALLCCAKSLALQSHHGRPRSSTRNFNYINKVIGASKVRSPRIGPQNPPSIPRPSVRDIYARSESVRVEYARFRTPGDEMDLHLGIIHTPQDTDAHNWSVPLSKIEFDEFREKYARPGSAIAAPPQQKADSFQPSQRASPINTLSKRKKKLVTIACLLAANAGFMNGVALSGIAGKAHSISAVTGAFTTAGVVASRSGLTAMATVLWTPFSYMVGSFVNGLWNPYGAVIGDSDKDESLSSLRTGPLLLSAAMVVLGNGLLSTRFAHLIATLTCWTFAMGLQNSWTSGLLKGNILRTAHYSGITSDIGTILGQTLRGNHENSWKVPIFAKLAASFWAGGIVSSLLGLHFSIPASQLAWLSTSLYVGVWSHLSRHHQKLPGVAPKQAQESLSKIRRQLQQLQLQNRQRIARNHNIGHAM